MWHRAAKISDIAEGASQSLDINGQSIALFRLKGKFYALDNHCLHRGGPLGDGHLDGTVVTCPWHAWQFDIKSGECQTMQGAKQKCYATKIEKGEVWVETSS